MKQASAHPQTTGKICGAGGGGCFFVYSADPKDKEKLAQELRDSGLRPLPFQTVQKGLDIDYRATGNA